MPRRWLPRVLLAAAAGRRDEAKAIEREILDALVDRVGFAAMIAGETPERAAELEDQALRRLPVLYFTPLDLADADLAARHAVRSSG